MSEQERARTALLALLERKHGLGSRSAWVLARLDRALEALIAETGDATRALDLVRADPARLAELADVLRVGETSFYRDPPQWEALRRVVLPRLAGRSRWRGLSVGCSTGQETWTLAMLLVEAASAGAARRVVGVDRSEIALETARAGRYPADGARQLPSDLRERFVTIAGEELSVSSELRESVIFSFRDVLSGPPPGNYEIIVCKNLLIYFADDAAGRVVKSLLDALATGGVLVVARSEVPRLRALGAKPEEIAPGITVFTARG